MFLTSRYLIRAGLISGLFSLLILSSNASAGISSSQFSLEGYLNDGSPANFDLAALEAYAAANPDTVKSVSVANKTGGVDVYTGISLGSFFSSYVKSDPGVPKNDILRDYVIATGSDGYKAVFSLAEMASDFGARNDILAYQLNGAELTDSGFARIVAPEDLKAGRWVSNLSSLYVEHVAYSPSSGGISSQFVVDGEVGQVITYDHDALVSALPAVQVTVQSGSASLNGTTFTGVSLWDLLGLSQILVDPNVKNDTLGKYVIATGSDGYQAVFALGELNPGFGNSGVLVGYDDGSGGLGNKGIAELIVLGDIYKGGRYVSNLVSLTVVSAVPLPAAAWLFASALGLVSIGSVKRGRRLQ
jgi:hypothetical protein